MNKEKDKEKKEDSLTEEQRKVINEIKKDHEENAKYYRRILYVMYSLALIGILVFIYFSPTFSNEEWEILTKFPNSLERLRTSVSVIKKYSNDNPIYVYALFVYLYLSLQSLGIIGCGVLSIMSGALFSFWTAIITVSLCASTGATLCYLLSKSVLRGFIVNMQEKRIANFAMKIERNKRNIFFYFISLRFSPVFPNLFVNLASPIVGVSIETFFFGTLLGLIPLNVIHIKTGATLDSITDLGASPMDIGFLVLISIAVLIPTLFNKKKIKSL
jgi:uncharacterized membrane protein YdjX (TVP38/TMEM64 family)